MGGEEVSVASEGKVNAGEGEDGAGGGTLKAGGGEAVAGEEESKPAKDYEQGDDGERVNAVEESGDR